MNFSPRSVLPFPISRNGDVPVWPLNRAADEYAVSPIDVIRSFLKQQELVFSRRSPWNSLFVVAAYDLTTHPYLINEATNSFAYLVINAPVKLLEWERMELLEAYLPGELFSYDPLELDVAEYSVLSTPAYTLIAADEPLDDEQLVFPLRKEFIPSKALIDLWTKSVRSYVSAPQLEAKLSMSSALSDSELKQVFTKILQTTLGLVAQQLRYEHAENLHITRNGRFGPRLQLELCEQFLVGGYEASAFLTMLGDELSAAVAEDTEIQGGWGTIQSESNRDLIYDLNAPNIAADNSFVRATRDE